MYARALAVNDVSPPVKLRAAARGDLPDLVALDALCFPPDVRYAPDVMAYYAFHPRSRTIVAEREGVICAFVIAHLVRKAGEIVTIDVHPSERKQHFGTRLMDAAEQWIAETGATSVRLDVDADNLAALELYRQLGYVVAAEYGDGRKRRYRMHKPLARERSR